MNVQHRFLLPAVLVLLLAGCASSPEPVVPTPPSVQVTQLDSLVFTPDVIKFQAKVVIRNRMRAGLDLQKVDYGVDVHDQPVFTDSFSALHPIKSKGRETVTFPFQIAMDDVLDRAVDILAEEQLRVSFRGQVYPVGFDPVAFEATRTIPLPRIPAISLEGTRSSAIDRTFTVLLKITNTNSFPLNVESIDSYLEINGTTYSLLRTEESTEIQPDSAETIALTVEQSTAKTLSMILNLVQSGGSLQFALGGDIRCQTPYGLIFIPVSLSAPTTPKSDNKAARKL